MVACERPGGVGFDATGAFQAVRFCPRLGYDITMGFRCSLLGHDYGESEVDRDREERGDEVVVTVHEFRTCERCGKNKTVSENKEVTSIAADEAVVDGADADDAVLIEDVDDGPAEEVGNASSAGPADEQQATPDISEREDDGVAPDRKPTVDGPTAAGDSPTAGGEHPGQEQTTQPSERGAGRVEDDVAGEPDEEIIDDPARDDGVILEDGQDEAEDREYGEWPEHEHSEGATDETNPSEWPETVNNAGHAAVPPEESADADVDFEDGELVPGATAYPDEDVQVIEDESAGGPAAEQVAGETAGGDTGITSAGSVPSPDTGSPSRTNEPLVCPECEMTARSRDSLRQGDICPECKRGYLTERERNR